MKKRAYEESWTLIEGIEKKYYMFNKLIYDNTEVNVSYYIACFEREMTVPIKRGLKEIALKIMEDAYFFWCEYPEEVGDACCEEYIHSRLIYYGLINEST